MTLEELIRRIPSMAVEAVCVARRDHAGGDHSVVWVNDAFRRMFAVTDAQVIATDPFALYHWDYLADFKSAMVEMDAAGETSFTQDTLCLRDDGSSFWGGVSFMRVVDDEGAGGYAITIVRDIDTLKNREQSAELALIENEHLLAKVEAMQTRLMSAINMSPDPFCIFDARDRLVIWNPAFAETVSPDPAALRAGMKNKAIMEMCLSHGFIDEAVGREDAYLQDFLDAWKEGRMPKPVMQIRGRDYKVIRSKSPNGDHVVLRVDISEQLRQQRELRSYADRLERANREISEQALQDELTGLGNRRYLNKCLEELIEARRATGLEIAVLHIDLDRFKQINDTMGHAVGDYVLERVAEILKTRVRSRDMVARIGGDEFIVLMLCAENSDGPEKLADRLIEEICKPIHYQDRPCRIGASVGIARTPMISDNDLITCSDIALYKAKTGGRAMKAVFDHGDLEQLQTSKRLSDDILRGLEMDEFVPMYQPQIDTATGEVVAIEVLSHWRNPTRGLLPASEFLANATEVHAEGRIEAMVFSKAIAECALYFDEMPEVPTLAFNVSLSRLTDPDLIEEIRVLDFPGRIAFELTETILLEDGHASVFERLDELRKMGVSIEVDDFGSGRASIVGLRRIAPDRLKIDKRLVQPMTTTKTADQLVGSILEIGRALGIGITADGVETSAHAAKLIELGGGRGQGVYYGGPGPLATCWPTPAQGTQSAAQG
ncbi:MAG: EAL domain-containing protein [Pseudomonadota bacterium]